MAVGADSDVFNPGWERILVDCRYRSHFKMMFGWKGGLYGGCYEGEGCQNSKKTHWVG